MYTIFDCRFFLFHVKPVIVFVYLFADYLRDSCWMWIWCLCARAENSSNYRWHLYTHWNTLRSVMWFVYNGRRAWHSAFENPVSNISWKYLWLYILVADYRCEHTPLDLTHRVKLLLSLRYRYFLISPHIALGYFIGMCVHQCTINHSFH